MLFKRRETRVQQNQSTVIRPAKNEVITRLARTRPKKIKYLNRSGERIVQRRLAVSDLTKKGHASLVNYISSKNVLRTATEGFLLIFLKMRKQNCYTISTLFLLKLIKLHSQLINPLEV